MHGYALDPACSCEQESHSDYGPVRDDERLVRVITDKHYFADGTLRPTAFDLRDIRSEGVSLVRVDAINVVEFQAIAEDIRRVSKSKAVEGALTARAAYLRSGRNSDGAKELCVIDDPVKDESGLRDNEAHAIAVSSVEISEVDAKEIRDRLLSDFTDAKYLNEIWQKQLKDILEE